MFWCKNRGKLTDAGDQSRRLTFLAAVPLEGLSNGPPESIHTASKQRSIKDFHLATTEWWVLGLAEEECGRLHFFIKWGSVVGKRSRGIRGSSDQIAALGTVYGRFWAADKREYVTGANVGKRQSTRQSIKSSQKEATKSGSGGT